MRSDDCYYCINYYAHLQTLEGYDVPVNAQLGAPKVA